MRITSYFQGVLTELKKVTWPSWMVVLKYFLAVVVGVALATLLVWGFDYFFIHVLLVAIIK